MDENAASLEYLSQFDAPMFDVNPMPYDQFSMAAAATVNPTSNPSFLVDWTDPNNLEFDNFIDPMRN